MEFYEKFKYPIIGGLVGLILAILLMAFGLFKTLLAIIFIILGIYGGLYAKKTGIIDQFLNRK
ncbi:TPA: DUF2273 domain-containing protein [Streptococcus pyogenes]|uniref:Small integral membrane protein n=1 Tax=Streptococcus pyogenes TaxID=1314 RepID=A0A8B6IXR2_STRPY|nr:DUF2273 domain-containing protein [Streptococcus pyogenes]HER4535158.1 DUF2273 domain-containing protein [Streptococcus pyogenes NGAS757]HER4586516.1 DUF2273 domain-containing protein [Streptococcus pyogenes NGAS615]HER4595007.1 DUF2273 domain-containing protein [Streptococcus pyogenes NGAS613]HER4601864.1 DUF2273 domain-containing protein [Streptococcus pyogenes NGAS608]HER4605015.1 DUF2273 domain-containing protein [Streptococcus pyogenes NGAS609]HER4608434.1 DUF2273 domain-containing pr